MASTLMARFVKGKLARKMAEEKASLRIAGKKVELATTNIQKDKAIEELKEAKEALKIAVLEHTPLFSPASSYLLKCHQGDELFPCHNLDVCGLCRKPEKASKGILERGYHLGDDPAVWVCDRFGHPKVIGCRCPKCTTEQGCKYFYYWEPGAGFPIIGKELSKGTWLPSTSGYNKGIKVEGGQLKHYSIPKVLPVGMYLESPTEPGMCRECLYWDHRLQCPCHIGGEGYWVLRRHYPLHLEWALVTYKPRWEGIDAPMLRQQRDHLSDARKQNEEQLLADIDSKMMKERAKAIYSLPPAKPHLKTERETLDSRLTSAVASVALEWEQIQSKNRIGVQV